MSGCEVVDVVLADGRRLRARHWPGRGRPLVLLHGFLDSSEGWEALATGTHRPCVAFDLPGFGGSATPRRALMSSYAEDLLAGLEQLAIADCTLVGHSLGGAVAVALAERSACVHSLALLAPAGFGPIRLADAFALPGVNAVAARALPFALASPPVVAAAYMTFVSNRVLPSRDLLARVRQSAWSSGPGARAAIVALARAGHAPDGYHLRRVDFDGPVAGLWGDRDALVPHAHTDGLRSALPQAHIETWRGMGHHPQRERPDQLRRFIELRASRARRDQRRRRRPAALGSAVAAPRRAARAA